MTTNTNAASADLHRLGAKAFSEYLEDCDKHAIKRDIASAFTYAFEAGAALSAAAQPPAGFVMVPIEPTIGMCIAGDEARITVDDPTRTPAVYRAMLAARPGGQP